MENGNEWDKISKTKSSVVYACYYNGKSAICHTKIYAVEKNDVKVAYREFLSEQNLLWTNRYTTDEGIKFRLEDLNKDGKQELLIYDECGSNATGQLAVYAYIMEK